MEQAVVHPDTLPQLLTNTNRLGRRIAGLILGCGLREATILRGSSGVGIRAGQEISDRVRRVGGNHHVLHKSRPGHCLPLDRRTVHSDVDSSVERCAGGAGESSSPAEVQFLLRRTSPDMK